MWRGLGFTMVELGKLDEAELAYRQALKISARDTLSQSELAYIARLRAGGPKADSYSSTVHPPSAGEDVPMEKRAQAPDPFK